MGTAVRRFPFPRVWGAVSAVPLGSEKIGNAEKIGAIIERIGARMHGAQSCLPQALAGIAMLRRHGHVPELVIGVCRSEGFAAHAWVEVAGRAVVGGSRAEGFSVLWRGA